MLTLPTLLFGFLLSLLYGALFHLWRGGNLVRLVYYLMVGSFGFWIGHFIGNGLDWTFYSIGALRVGMGTVVSLIFLGLGYWLVIGQDQPAEGKQ